MPTPTKKKAVAKKPAAKKSVAEKSVAKKSVAKPAADAADKKLARIFGMSFASVYPLYVQKVERKGRTRADVDTVIRWLTGYSEAGLRDVIATGIDFEAFFARAPKLHPNVSKITGVVCGVRVEEVEHPLMQKIRWLDLLVDEVARGKAMERILRA